MTEPQIESTLDYNRYPPITIFISSKDNHIGILVDPPNLLAVEISELLREEVDLSSFMGLPNTKQLLYNVKATIEENIQRWIATQAHRADQWPKINIVVGSPPEPTLKKGKNMKFTVTFKTPDAVHMAIDRTLIHATNEEEKLLREEKIEEIKEFTNNWVRHNECIDIEFSEEANTATVLPNLTKR